MADEIKYSGIGDLRTAEVLMSQWLLLLANRSVIMDHPALMYAGNVTGSGSGVIKIPQIGLGGYDLLAVDASENTTIANTALTDGSGTVTVQRYAKIYSRTDLAGLTDSQGLLSQEMFALDGFMAAQSTVSSLIANLMDNFSNGVGSSGVDTDLATFLAAQSALEARNVTGEFLSLLHSAQWGHLKEELALVSGGAVVFADATQAQIAATGPGLKGKLLGTDVIVNNFVPTSGSDRVGGMFGRGAIAWADGTPPVDDPSRQRVMGQGVMFETGREVRESETLMVTTMYYGVTEQIDAAGESITGAGS